MAAQPSTDERLTELATALAPLPVRVAELAEAVHHLQEETRSLRHDLNGETLALRQELAAAERQLVQLAWGIVAALLGGLIAVLAAVL
jgi:predicted  nucleic acid-binding Zn-ribbon protein